MQNTHVLVTIPMDEAQKKRLEMIDPSAKYHYIPKSSTTAKTNPSLREEDVVPAEIILGNVPVDFLENNKSLRFLQLDSSGATAYVRGGLPKEAMLTNATGAYGLALSETMLAMTLLLKKRMHAYIRQQIRHEWQCVGRVTSIHGSTVLCVGMGNIGSEFLKKCKALGAYTIGVRRAQPAKPDWLDELHFIEELDDLLSRADVVALNLPDTPKTQGLFDAKRLSRLRSDAILINMGRGSVLDTNALLKMLQDGRLAGAGLDVTDPEPLPSDHPLWDAPNVIITPHVSGGFTLKETLDNIVEITIENYRRFLAGEPLMNQVDMEEGYAVIK